jgi:multidrug efflux pump subunit AcrB
MDNTTHSRLSVATLSIRRHIGTLMLTIAVIVLGVFFISSLQVDLLPSITYPRIGVRLSIPGASPEVAVDEVTRPLEEALSATEGVVQVFSQTREGRVSLDLFFQPGGDVNQALNDATATFNRARSNLPDTVEDARLFKFDPSQLPVYEFALTSGSLQPVDLRVFADEELGRELGVVPGVAAVDVSGGVEEEVRVTIDLNRLQALGVGLNEVLDALDENNQDMSGGRILGNVSEPLTRTMGRFQTVDDLAELSFESRSPTLDAANSDTGMLAPMSRVYLRDFSTLLDGTQEQRIFVTLNGQSAVKVSVQKQPDANTVQVVDGLQQRLEQLRQQHLIPDDMVLVTTLDESVFIRNAIRNVVSSGLIGSLLAAIAVFFFLGSLRQTFIILLAIPLATLAAIILMKFFGLSINVFSLGGLALGVGIVVDNSIVMLETLVADCQGLGRNDGTPCHKEIIQQSIQSCQSIESALIASTSTNLVAVLPFLFLGGFISLLFNELILTISFAVAASILVALTVVPMLVSRLLGVPQSSQVCQMWMLRTFNQRFEAANLAYAQSLRWVVNRRSLMIGLAIVVFGGSSLFLVQHIPQEILPSINTGQANLSAQFPPGTPLETSREIMTVVDEILLAQPETDYAFTTVGGSLFGSNTSENPLRASSTITLKPGSDVEAYTEKVTQSLSALNLVDTTLRISPGQVRGLVLSNSPIRGADIDLIFQGEDATVLEQAGRQVLKALAEQAKFARFRPDADSRQPEIQIYPDRERLADLGLSIQDVGETLETAIAGTVPTQLQRGNRLVDVRVELDNTDIQRPSQLNLLPLFTDRNQLVRLGDVATFEAGQAPGEIQRINQRQVFLIAGSLNEGATLGEALAEVDRILATVPLPDGVSRLPSVAAQSNDAIQATLPILGGLAAFLVFVVMAVQYNSLVDPLVIMFTIPLALAGGIWGLFLTQTAIGATVIVGAVLLVGIVVNNAIIMVEYANQTQEREGCDRRSAILKAAPQRLRPVLMTTVTTVLGMFPLALGQGAGGEFLQPLGVVVFSGLSFATVLTLFIIPCFYVLLHDWFDRGSGQSTPRLRLKRQQKRKVLARLFRTGLS